MRIKNLICFLTIFLFHASESQTAIAQSILVSNLSDFRFEAWSGYGPIDLSNQICVYVKSPFSSFQIRPLGSGPGGELMLRGISGEIPYKLHFKTIEGSFTELDPHRFTTIVKSEISAASCSGLSNAELKVSLPEASLKEADSGNYFGYITILITP